MASELAGRQRHLSAKSPAGLARLFRSSASSGWSWAPVRWDSVEATVVLEDREHQPNGELDD
jgi:hypothetical protein